MDEKRPTRKDHKIKMAIENNKLSLITVGYGGIWTEMDGNEHKKSHP